MASPDLQSPRRRGLTLDVWCDPAEEIPIIEAELEALGARKPKGSDRRRLAALNHELGRLQLHRGDDAAAARAFLAAYSLAPRFRPNLRTAQNLYELRRDHRLLVKLVKAEAAASKEPTVRAGLLRRQAHLLWARLDNPGEAREVLAEAHALQPGDLSTLKLQELICAATGDLPGAEQQLKLQIRLLPPSVQTAALLTCRGLLAAASQPDRAAAALRKAVEIAPGEMEAAGRFLEQILEERGETQALASLLETLAGQDDITQERRARLLARAARLLGADTSKHARALAHQSLELHPTTEVAEDLLEAALREGDTEGAVKVGELLLTLDPPPLEARRVCAELADLHRALLRDPAAAAGWYRRALTIDPAHQASLEGLELLLGSGGVEVGELLEHRRRALAVARHPADLLSGQLALAQLLERSGLAEEALEVHGKLLERWPGFVASQLSQERLFTRLQRWTELLQLYDEMHGLATDGEQTVRILERMASVWQHQLGQPDVALECHQQILSGDPEHLPSIRAAARLCAMTGRHRELVDLTEKEVALTSSPARKADLLCTSASVWLEHLEGGEEHAVQCYRQALLEDPGCATAFEALRRLYRHRRHWSRLETLLSEEVERLPEPAERVPLLVELAALREQELGLMDEAIQTYREALTLDPSRPPLVEALARLLRAAERWEELAAMLEQGAEAGAHAHTRAAWLLAAGNLCEERLDNLEDASRLYRQALAAVPAMPAALQGLERLGEAPPASPPVQAPELGPGAADSSVTRTRRVPLTSAAGTRSLLLDGLRGPSGGEGELALRARERSLRLADEPAQLEQLLTDRLDRDGDPMERSCLNVELAELAAARGDLAAAESRYEEALGNYEGHPGALWGLARLLTRQGRWADVADIFLREADTMESPRCRQDALIRAGMVLEDQVGSRGRAAALYRRVLEEDPLHEEANERLAACLEGDEHWTALASLLRARINATTSPDRQAASLCRLGELYIQRLGEERKGLACLRRAAELDPDNLTVQVALADQHYARQEWAEAEELYTKTISTVGESGERARIRRRLGELQLGMDMPLAALSSLQQAAEDDEQPAEDTLRLMLRAAQAARDLDTQREAITQLIQLTHESGDRVELLKEEARLLDEEAGRPREAITRLEEALDLAPLDISVIERLAAVHGSRGDREAAEGHLTRSAARVRDALTLDPLAGDRFQHLGRIHKWQRQYDAFFCTCVARAHLEEAGGQEGLLDEAERRFLKLHQYRCAPVPSGGLTRYRYEQLLVPAAASGALRQLLQMVRPTLHRLLASKPAALGLSDRDKVVAGHPLRTLCEEAADQLGGVTFDLYISPARKRLVAAEILDAPALLVGADLARGLISPSERFLIGRALFLINEGALPLLDMTSRRAAVLLTALGRAARPTCELPLGEQGEAVRTEALRLVDQLDAQELERLGEALPAVTAGLAGEDLAVYREAVVLGANRAGMALAGDPLQALQEAAALEDADGIGPRTADLLAFLVDPRFLALRRDLGLSPGAGE